MNDGINGIVRALEKLPTGVFFPTIIVPYHESPDASTTVWPAQKRAN